MRPFAAGLLPEPGGIRPGALVIVHLVSPTEKLWGFLDELAGHGLMLRALSLSTFEDWMASAARQEPQTLGLATLFVPLFRVEKIFLDEDVGEVASYQRRFAERVGVTVQEYLGADLGLESGDDDLEGEVPS